MCGTFYEFVWQEGTPLPKNFPFCSERCKTADLAKWLNEEYVVSAPRPAGISSEMEEDIRAALAALDMLPDDDTD